jgi:hypothetical protein
MSYFTLMLILDVGNKTILVISHKTLHLLMILVTNFSLAVVTNRLYLLLITIRDYRQINSL